MDHSYYQAQQDDGAQAQDLPLATYAVRDALHAQFGAYILTAWPGRELPYTSCSVCSYSGSEGTTFLWSVAPAKQEAFTEALRAALPGHEILLFADRLREAAPESVAVAAPVTASLAHTEPREALVINKYHEHFQPQQDDGAQQQDEPSNNDEPTAGLELTAAALFTCVNAHQPAVLGALVTEHGAIPTAWRIVDLCERFVGKPWVQTSVAPGAVEAVVDYLSAVFGTVPVEAYASDVGQVVEVA